LRQGRKDASESVRKGYSGILVLGIGDTAQGDLEVVAHDRAQGRQHGAAPVDVPGQGVDVLIELLDLLVDDGPLGGSVVLVQGEGAQLLAQFLLGDQVRVDRKSTRLNSSHVKI